MKTVVLIGDPTKAYDFIRQVASNHEQVAKNVYKINGENLKVTYDANVARVARGSYSGIIIIKEESNQIASDIYDHLTDLPSDTVHLYKNENEPAGEFLQGMIKDLKPVASRTSESLFSSVAGLLFSKPTHKTHRKTKAPPLKI